MRNRTNMEEKNRQFFCLKEAHIAIYLPFRLLFLAQPTSTNYSLFLLDFLHNIWFLGKNDCIKHSSFSTPVFAR